MVKILLFTLLSVLAGWVATFSACDQPFGGATVIDRSGEFAETDSDRWGAGTFGLGEAVPTQSYVPATPWPEPTGTPLPVEPTPEVPTAVPVTALPEGPPPADPAGGDLKAWEEIDADPPPGVAPPGEGAYCYSHYSAGLGLAKVWFTVGEAPAPHHIYKCIAGPDGQPMWARK